MKNFFPTILTICVALSFASCANYYGSNDEAVNVLLTKTEQTIDELGDKVANSEDDKLLETFRMLQEESNALLPALKKCNDNYALTETYIETLQEAENALKQLISEFDSRSDKAFVINAIYQDYHAKLESINSSKKSDANTKIKVVVDSSEDDGFFVFAKLSYEKDADVKRFRFNRPTHNATLSFVPGYYLFWLEKDDLVSEPELHLISISGSEKEKKIVLKTPKK